MCTIFVRIAGFRLRRRDGAARRGAGCYVHQKVPALHCTPFIPSLEKPLSMYPIRLRIVRPIALHYNRKPCMDRHTVDMPICIYDSLFARHTTNGACSILKVAQATY